MQVTIPLREQQSHSNLSFEFILQFLSSFPEESSACFPLDQDHWGFSSLSTPSTHAILSVFHRQRNKPAQDSVILFMFPSSSTRSSFIWALESSSGEYLLRLRQRRPGMRDGKEDKAWTYLRNSKTRGKEGTLVMKVFWWWRYMFWCLEWQSPNSPGSESAETNVTEIPLSSSCRLLLAN